ncbi:hypothetical protein [Aquimarina sp. 2201CG5-10]|uniref:hypothetical protein n=1 Tax=Aquimarina callyspongiae TaxID=3098150 RepID=UPI002AB4008D|nr:hypothetical protein [Aquimarina sp. 2201CG5-10]MDY8134670.1 hypothetical protein [Aquimarina sp. 2201CG5-10]
MEKDLKELFEKERNINHPRKPDHEIKFITRLYEELPNKNKSSYLVFKIAASVVFIIGIGIAYYISLPLETTHQTEVSTNFSLGQLSPDLEKIENYYTSNIEMMLVEIEENRGNKSFKDRYFKRLSLLQEEYEVLITEIREGGPNSFTISAIINNLRLQLELLEELNQEITSSKNEHHEII